jgi:hypothetical protein
VGTNLEGRLTRLEIIWKAAQALFTKIGQRLDDIEGRQRTTGGGFSGGGASGATVWWIPAGSAVVIAAGGSNTADVYGVGGLLITGATVLNKMGSATVTGKTIVVGANGDGTFLVLSQSCT